MRENLTIYELKKYYEEHKPTAIYFLTNEQEWSDTADSLKLKIAFNQITIVQNPKLIYLTNGSAQMHMNQIRRIRLNRVSAKYPELGDILSVTSLDRNGNDITYQFLVS